MNRAYLVFVLTLPIYRTLISLKRIVSTSIDSWKSDNLGKPSKEFSGKHRRGKSETLRAQYINTKDVRFGSVRCVLIIDLLVPKIYIFHPLMDIIISSISHFCVSENMIWCMQSDNRHVECCWKSSRRHSWDWWVAVYARSSRYIHSWVSINIKFVKYFGRLTYLGIK